jgi:4-hydroxyphenylpyruvate dioxygenase-like putative hemolysin
MTKVLLQIFSANLIGPIFFEFIQRKRDEGFGEAISALSLCRSRKIRSAAELSSLRTSNPPRDAR